MKQDKLDAILQSEETLEPSSGFLTSVMERVQKEAVAPPPIPFPWKRFLPGAVLLAALLGWSAVNFVRHFPHFAASVTAPQISADILLSRPMQDAGYIVLALAISLFSWLLSRSIVGRSGLL